MSKECNLVRELFPLYAEQLVSAETAAYIEDHLAGCPACTREWEGLNRPLPDPLPQENRTSHQGFERKLFTKLKKTMVIAALLIVMGGTGIAGASYLAGKNIGMDDPVYRFAQELDLFTEINATKTVDDIQITVNKGLFDSTRSVIFLQFSDSSQSFPQVTLADDQGNQYDEKSGKGWENKYFMLEFEPLKPEAQAVNLSLALGEAGEETKARTEYTFPVDVVKTAQYTRIIYPNQEKTVASLRISLEKVILGVSESEVRLKLDWPTDYSVAGIGVGRGEAYFPTSIVKAPDTPPPPGEALPPPGGLMSGYASASGINYSSDGPPENRPALYDLTKRSEVEVENGEYRTTQFPCQVEATLKFAPVSQETEELEVLLPPIYLYQKVAEDNELLLDFRENGGSSINDKDNKDNKGNMGNIDNKDNEDNMGDNGKKEINLSKSMAYPEGEIILEKAWRENDTVSISYRLSSSSAPGAVLPHFELKSNQGMKLGEARFDRENPNLLIFSLYEPGSEEMILSLDSIGNLLPREKFTLDFGDSKE